MLSGLTVWRIVAVLMAFWLIVLLVMSSSLYQSSSNTDESLERQLFNAVQNLNSLRAENHALKKEAEELRKMKANAEVEISHPQSRLKSVSSKLGGILRPPASNESGEFQSHGEPTLAGERYRRAVENDVVEMWYYLQSQLNQLRHLLESSSPSLKNVRNDVDGLAVHSMLTRVNDVIQTGVDYKRTILRDLHNLTNIHAEWRKSEAASLSALIQRRIQYLQNPKDCKNARKLVCNINKGCGFGCQLHHLTYCFIAAYGTNRTLIISSRGWRYSPSGGWEKYFLPVSDTCVDRYGASRPWSAGTENTQVVEMPIVDSLSPRPPFMPQAIPADLAPRLLRLHGHPFVWWISQFVSYLFRPQPRLVSDIEQTRQKLGFHHPIVGIHVRRTDKVGAEAAFHSVDEYMAHVDDYYETLEKREHVDRRRVYIATDDPSVINDAKRKYPNYDVLGDPSLSKSAGLNRRYSEDSLRGVIIDIYLLSVTDYLVCTFSSQVCRVAYELMQSMHPDASRYFHSLDDVYYYGGQNAHYQVALVEHKPRPGTDELELVPGKRVSIAGNHWDGFSKGRCERTGRVGIYPSYKVREHVDVVEFPTYPEADTVKS